MNDETPKTYIQIGNEQVDASMVTLPESERRFRNAWISESEEAIGVDMPMARDIARTEIRTKREELFKRLDVDYQRAHETGADTSAIVAAKQKLRDYPADNRLEEAQDDMALVQALDTILGEMETV